jgi:predicted TIM-barrel fold metal-dependent hydrolase
MRSQSKGFELMGVANIVFSTDFPHTDCKYPRAVARFLELPLPLLDVLSTSGESRELLAGAAGVRCSMRDSERMGPLGYS